ncbi:MAG: hypothetical protein EOR51_30120 [Mesorhizobium sp.]|nr:MAG: hypothetical protein EOR51_30120 [Mesorhizobium sp.]
MVLPFLSGCRRRLGRDVEILLIVQVIGRSGILDPFARRIPEVARSETGILAILCNLTAGISVFMNNIGALALMIPVVTSVCRVSGLDQRRVLMQVSFAALLGGLCSIIGTPANLIVSNQLAAVAGEGFAFFDYAWVGVPAAFAGLIVLLIWPGRILGAGLRHRAGYRRRPFEPWLPMSRSARVRRWSEL